MTDIFFFTVSFNEDGFNIDWIGMYLSIELPVIAALAGLVVVLRARKLYRDRRRRKDAKSNPDSFGGWDNPVDWADTQIDWAK